MGKLLFVTGGARSGKSTFAERLASQHTQVRYVATMQPLDEELRERVARHREQRPASWVTVEAPLEIARAIREAPSEDCVLLDCLSLWVTNQLLTLDSEEPELSRIAALEATLDRDLAAFIEAVAARGGTTIVVTNEVGSGVVPPYPLGRVYRDLLGRANQHISLAADRAWLLVSDRALELPAPSP